MVSGTDTLGVGVNIPIRTVLFTQLCKYDGAEGRASCRCASSSRSPGAPGARASTIAAGWWPRRPRTSSRTSSWRPRPPPGKKVHKQKPPDKGYVHWDKGTFDRLVGGTPEPLESRFAVSHGLLLALLQGEQRRSRAGAAATGGCSS